MLVPLIGVLFVNLQGRYFYTLLLLLFGIRFSLCLKSKNSLKSMVLQRCIFTHVGRCVWTQRNERFLGGKELKKESIERVFCCSPHLCGQRNSQTSMFPILIKTGQKSGKFLPKRNRERNSTSRITSK